MSKMLIGLGSGTFPIFKDLYKCLAKALFDRVMAVKVAAANVFILLGNSLNNNLLFKCFACLVAIPDSPLFIQHNLESICTLCIKVLHISNSELRLAVANIFAKLAVASLKSSIKIGLQKTGFLITILK